MSQPEPDVAAIREAAALWHRQYSATWYSPESIVGHYLEQVPALCDRIQELEAENARLRVAVNAALCNDAAWWETCETALCRTSPPTSEPRVEVKEL